MKHLRNLGFSPATVVDVGVADGTFELYEGFPQARHILIEPMAEFAEALRIICRRYDALHVAAAASNEEGLIELLYGSSLHGASVLQERDEDSRNAFERRQVKATTLDTCAKIYGVSGPCLLKVDVQGYELSVLQGGSNFLQQCEVIVLECSLFSFQHEAPVVGEVLAYLHQRDFVPYDFIGGHCRPYDNALAQIDVAFVRKDGDFRRSDMYATEGQYSALEKSPMERVLRWLDRR